MLGNQNIILLHKQTLDYLTHFYFYHSSLDSSIICYLYELNLKLYVQMK